MSIELTKDADKMICEIYAAYMKRRTNGVSKRAAKDFADQARWPVEYSAEWASEDGAEFLAELKRAGLIKLYLYDGFSLNDEAIIYMETALKMERPKSWSGLENSSLRFRLLRPERVPVNRYAFTGDPEHHLRVLSCLDIYAESCTTRYLKLAQKHPAVFRHFKISHPVHPPFLRIVLDLPPPRPCGKIRVKGVHTVDKLSLKVLKHIASQQDDISATSIIALLGDASKKSLVFLEKEGFIKSGSKMLGISADMKPVFTSNGIYGITSKGIAFLEDRPGKVYDKWSTRFFAIWGAVTGTAAIVIELVLHFL